MPLKSHSGGRPSAGWNIAYDGDSRERAEKVAKEARAKGDRARVEVNYADRGLNNKTYTSYRTLVARKQGWS